MKQTTSPKQILFNLLTIYFLLCQPILLLSGNSENKSTKSPVQFWLTDPANNILFKQQSDVLKFSTLGSSGNSTTIEINPGETFQSVDGFGWCLTGGSATLIHQMETSKRAALLQELFGNDGSNLGVSYLRISIGASDLSEDIFSYDDLPAGETDVKISPVKKQI